MRRQHTVRRGTWMVAMALAIGWAAWGLWVPVSGAGRSAQPTAEATATEAATTVIETPTPGDTAVPATETATPAPTETPSPLPSPTETAIPTITLTPSRTPLPTVTPTPTATPCGPIPTPDPGLVVEAQVEGNIVRGHTLPNGRIDVVVRDAGGAQMASRTVNAAADGGWRVDLFVDPNASIPKPLAMKPGWQVTVTAQNGSATIRLAAMTILMNPDSRTISGTAPAGSIVHIRASFHYEDVQLTVDGQGRYQTQWFGSGDLGDAGVWGEVLFPTAAGQWVFARDRLASVVVELGSPVIRITAPPLSHISGSVEQEVNGIRRILGTVTGEINGLGEVETTLKDQSTGRPIPIAPGHTIIATSSSFQATHRLRVPSLSGYLAPGGKYLIGTGPPGKDVKARFEWQDLPAKWCEVRQEVRQAHCDANGRFLIPLAPTRYYPAPLPRPVSELARLTLFYQTPERDEVRLPIGLGYSPITGRVWLPICGYYWLR